MIDPWRRLDRWNKPLNTDDGGLEAAFNEAMDATQFAEAKRIVLRGTTTEVIARVPDQSLDFIYIDGDHTLRGIAIDLINAYPKLKPGGYLAGDDFTSSIWQHDSRYEPTLVFPFATYFAEAVGMRCYALPFNQFMIAKDTHQCGYEFVDQTGKYKALTLGEQLSLGQLVRMKIKNLTRLS